MSPLVEYILSQTSQSLQSLLSGQRETNTKLDELSKKIDTRLTDLEEQFEEKRAWEQRLVWLGLALFMSVALNWNPEKVGEVLASALKGLK